MSCPSPVPFISGRARRTTSSDHADVNTSISIPSSIPFTSPTPSLAVHSHYGVHTFPAAGIVLPEPQGPPPTFHAPVTFDRVSYYEFTLKKGLLEHRTFYSQQELEQEIYRRKLHFTTRLWKMSFPVTVWICVLCAEVISDQARGIVRHCDTIKHTAVLSEHTGVRLPPAGCKCPTCGGVYRDDNIHKHFARCRPEDVDPRRPPISQYPYSSPRPRYSWRHLECPDSTESTVATIPSDTFYPSARYTAPSTGFDMPSSSSSSMSSTALQQGRLPQAYAANPPAIPTFPDIQYNNGMEPQGVAPSYAQYYENLQPTSTPNHLVQTSIFTDDEWNTVLTPWI